VSTRFQAFCDCGWSGSYSTAGRAELWLAKHIHLQPAREYRRSCRACGWSGGPYSSAAMADSKKKMHSCRRHTDAAAARARGEARRAAVDKTPKPCLHKIAAHVHGTHACYVLDACRCVRCTNANRLYEQERARLHAYGRWDHYVDAEPARQHVRALMAAGMGMKRIVATGAISQGGIWKLLYGKRKADGTRVPSIRVAKATAERLLAVELDLADGAKVDGADTSRRLQALVACGWSQAGLAERIGVDQSNFTPLVHGRRDVTVATAKAVHALYVELVEMAPPTRTVADRGSVSRSMNHAARMGWAPPLRINGKAFVGPPLPTPAHEDNLDELESAGYDEAAVLRRLAGDRNLRVTRAERIEIVRRARALGWSYLDIEARTGINKPERYIVDLQVVAS
jgi:transcriptional regulator with XRE-family HTH domain